MSTRPLDHLALLIDVQEEFLATLREVDPAAPVPSCGSWQVYALGVHLAKIHHSAAPGGSTPSPIARSPRSCERPPRSSP